MEQHHPCSSSSLRRMLPAIFSLCALSAAARGDILFNADIVNTTGNVANDFHVKMCASEPIDINTTWETGGDVVFPPGTIQGNGTNEVTIDWVGATVNDGQMAHFGAGTALGAGTPKDLKIKESWWTFGGAKLVSASSGRLASADFEGVGDWLVARVDLYDGPSGVLIGMEWIEGRGELINLYNLTDEPIFASLALRHPTPDMVPIELLNADLDGFGPAGDILVLMPEGAEPYCQPSGPNSVSPGGGRLVSLGGYGTPAARLLAFDIPNQFGVVYAGTTAIAVPFGCGQRCVGNVLVRYGPFLAAGNQLDVTVDMGFLPPGSKVQYWYRDPANAPNCGNVFNLSNALGN